MYETQETIPVRDWITLGGVLLGLILVVFLAVTLAENSSSSIQIVSGQLVTAQANGTPQAQGGNGQGQNGNQQSGGKIVTASGQNNVSQLSFFEVFLLLLLGVAVFTVVISVLIALLVIQLTRIFRQIQKKPKDNPPGQP